MLGRTVGAIAGISPAIRRAVTRTWYQYLVGLDRDNDMLFMNYGYVDLDPSAQPLALSARDERYRYCVQLYHHVAGAVDLRGLHVLEVGCGRGGGASYITRALKPRSMLGVDMASNAIAFCNRYHAVDGLSFAQGDAEALRLDDETFDAVVNVESSHCYGSMERFLGEVFRVLRPNGYFLYADFRPKNQIDVLQTQISKAGFEVLKRENIAPNVVKALELDSERKLELIRRKAPKLIHKQMELFAGIKGTPIFESFASGEREYLRFVLRKS